MDSQLGMYTVRIACYFSCFNQSYSDPSEIETVSAVRVSQDHELTGKWCIVGWVPTIRITPDTDIGLNPRLVRPTLTFKVKSI